PTPRASTRTAPTGRSPRRASSRSASGSGPRASCRPSATTTPATWRGGPGRSAGPPRQPPRCAAGPAGGARPAPPQCLPSPTLAGLWSSWRPQSRNRAIRGPAPLPGSGALGRLERQAQGAVEVAPEVAGVLDPDAEAKEGGRRAGRGVAGVAGAALDQALDAAEAGRVGDELDRLADALGGGGVADGLEGEQGAGAAHLAGRELVAGVVGEAGVAHPRDRRVGGEPARELAGRTLGAVEADGQRAQAAQGQERLQRAGHRDVGRAAVAQALGELGVARHERAPEQVRVAAEELARVVQNDV